MPRYTLNDLKSLPKAKRTERITFVSSSQEPDSLLEWMDVDRVAMAIRSARAGNTQHLFAIYRDMVLTHSHIQAEFSKRKIAVLGDRFRILPYDKRQDADLKTAEQCERSIYSISSWRAACAHLLDSALWPVSVVEKVFAPAPGGGFDLSELVPVPHYLLDFGSGRLSIRDTGPDGSQLGTVHDPDPERYIVHRGHLIGAPDNFGGPMRSLVYWWLCSTMNRDWWARFLERHGFPFMVGKYKPGNTSDRDILLGAMQSGKKLFGLAISNTTSLEIVEASKAGTDAFERFHDVCSREISKVILGQTLSAQASPTGELGSGTSGLQSDVREDIRKFDAAMLSDTLRDQLMVQLVSLAGLPGRAPYLVWGSLSTSELKAHVDVVVALRQAGFVPDDEGLEGISENLGYGIKPAPASPAMFSVDREVGAPYPFCRNP